MIESVLETVPTDLMCKYFHKVCEYAWAYREGHTARPEVEKVLKQYKSHRHVSEVNWSHDCIKFNFPVMLAATSLDVWYRLLLNVVRLESAKKMLMEQVSASLVSNFLSVTNITMYTTGMTATPVIHIHFVDRCFITNYSLLRMVPELQANVILPNILRLRVFLLMTKDLHLRSVRKGVAAEN